MKLHLPSPLLATLLALTAPAYATGYTLTTYNHITSDQTIGESTQNITGDVTINGNSWQGGTHANGHTLTLLSGADVTIGGGLSLVTKAKLIITDDAVLSVTGTISLGHPSTDQTFPGYLVMDGGSLTASGLQLYTNHANTVEITGGALSLTGSEAITAAPFNNASENATHSTVFIGGTGEGRVTLTATNENGLTFDYANLTLGNICVAEGSQNITFTGATLSGRITNSGTATITLAGATTIISDSLVDAEAFYTDTAGNTAANEDQNAYAKVVYTLADTLTLADGATLRYHNQELAREGTGKTFSAIDTSVYYIRTKTNYTQALTNAGTLRITEGKTLNMNGVATESKSIILEAGSTLANRGGVVGTHLQQNNNVTLLGNATMDAQSSFCMIGPNYADTRLDLGGHTLTKKGSDTLKLYNTAITAGTIDVRGGSITMESYNGRIGSLADGVKFNLAENTSVTFGSISGEQVGKAILASTGTGTFNISSNATLTGATDGSTTNSNFAGLLNVTGGTLTLGHTQSNSNSGWQISAADMDIQLAGGNLYYFGFDSSFGNLTVNKNASYTVYATDRHTVNHKELSIAAGATLTLSANWGNTNLHADSLTGDGNLNLDANLTATIDQVTDYQGSITIDQSSGRLTLGADERSTVSLSHTITNRGTVRLNGTIAVSSTGAYEAAQELRYTYSAENQNGFCTATGIYYLVKGGTTSFAGATLTVDGVVNNTLVSGQGGVTFDAALTSTEFFVTNDSLDEDTLISTGKATATTQYLLRGGTLATDNRIDSTRLRYSSGSLLLNTGGVLVISDTQDDNVALVRNSSGAGDIELNSTLTILSGELSGISGELMVNSGGSLQLGSTNFNDGTTGTASLSFSSGTLTLNGGTVRYRGGDSTITSMKVTDDSTLNLWDMKGDSGNPTTTFTIGSLNLGANLDVTSEWKYALEIGKLTGSGNLTLGCGKDKQSVTIAIASGYTGQLDLSPADKKPLTNMSVSLDVQADATARLKGNENNTTISSLKLAAGSSMKVEELGAGRTFTINQLSVDGASTLAVAGSDVHQAQFNIVSLSNSANGSVTNDVLTLESQSNTKQRTVFNLQGGNYEGTIRLLLNKGGESRKVALNLHDNAAANAVINLELGSGAAGTLALGLASDNVSVRGITGSVGTIYSGAQAFGNENDFQGDGTTRTLTIDTELEIYTTSVELAEGIYTTSVELAAGINLCKLGSGSQTFSGTVANSIETVQVDKGKLAFTNRADMSIEQLTLLGTATLHVSQNSTASTIAITDAVTLTGGARLEAGLDLTRADSLTLNADTDTTVTVVTIAGSLKLSGERTLSLAGNVLTQLSSLAYGDTLELFTGITSLVLGEHTYTLGGTDLSTEEQVLLGHYFTGVDGGSYALGYTASTGTLYVQNLTVPEPTTATLSLLALSALAARRRRRS